MKMRGTHFPTCLARGASFCAAILAAGLAASGAGAYVLGPDDVIEISVWRHPDLDRVIAISPDGNIALPLLGMIRASGRSPEDLAAHLTSLLSPAFFKEAQVSVAVRDYQSAKVHLLGQVVRQGPYPLKRPTSLTELISQAGGFAPGADPRMITVRRASGQVARCDLTSSLLGSGSQAALSQAQGAAAPPKDSPNGQDVILEPGDVVYVPKNTEHQIYVLGQVMRPGPLDIEENERYNVVKALAKAGGPTERASLKEAVVISRDGRSVSVDLEGQMAAGGSPMALSPGDALVVPENVKNKVFILGRVARQGAYDLKGRWTALQALAYAGGNLEGAALSKARLVRLSGDRPQVMTVDLSRVIKTGKREDDVELRAQDILFIPPSRSQSRNERIAQWLPALAAVANASQIFWVARLVEKGEL
jgi:polysaccharide export outer membrane protein